MSDNRFALIGELFTKKPLLIAAISAAAAMLFAAGFIKQREASILKVTEAVEVATSARDIAAGRLIDDSDITIAKVPRRFVEPGALANTSETAGRIAAIPIRSGTQFTLTNARKTSDAKGVSGIIPAGKRAVALSLDNASGLTGLLKPNDTVDILATFDLGQESAVRRTTLAIVENVTVLAVGLEVADAGPRPPSKDQKSGLFGGQGQQMTRDLTTVAMAVTPAEAQAISFARESGSLSLSLRPFGDDAQEEKTRPATIATITGNHDELIPMKKGFREYRGR